MMGKDYNFHFKLSATQDEVRYWRSYQFDALFSHANELYRFQLKGCKTSPSPSPPDCLELERKTLNYETRGYASHRHESEARKESLRHE